MFFFLLPIVYVAPSIWNVALLHFRKNFAPIDDGISFGVSSFGTFGLAITVNGVEVDVQAAVVDDAVVMDAEDDGFDDESNGFDLFGWAIFHKQNSRKN